ncbi:hypothetical protein RSAG8_05764, partial [Rhizoctonia solani AG-8 WAC10335]
MTQRGAVAQLTNDLSAKLSRAIRSVENVISVTETLNDRVKRSHQRDRGRTQDRRLDLPTRIAQSSVPTAAEYPKLDGQRDHGSALSGGGSLVNNQGKPSDASALRSVEAPESSVDGTDSGSTSGSECGTESTEAERHDDPVLGDVTDHVARWTTVGDDVTMRDTSNALKTVQPEQRGVSPKELQLKPDAGRRTTEGREGKGKGDGGGQ